MLRIVGPSARQYWRTAQTSPLPPRRSIWTVLRCVRWEYLRQRTELHHRQLMAGRPPGTTAEDAGAPRDYEVVQPQPARATLLRARELAGVRCAAASGRSFTQPGLLGPSLASEITAHRWAAAAVAWAY